MLKYGRIDLSGRHRVSRFETPIRLLFLLMPLFFYGAELATQHFIRQGAQAYNLRPAYLFSLLVCVLVVVYLVAGGAIIRDSSPRSRLSSALCGGVVLVLVFCLLFAFAWGLSEPQSPYSVRLRLSLGFFITDGNFRLIFFGHIALLAYSLIRRLRAGY